MEQGFPSRREYERDMRSLRRHRGAALAAGLGIASAYFRWGLERAFRPDSQQRSLASVASRVGASVVFGAHPHVLQPIERPRPRRLVAWSLGNFVFGATSAGTERTGILRPKVGHSGVLSHRFRHARIGGVFGIQPILE
jgi:poly-gamma-glutamate capsule biosynthesis protein CapA/YwtB (metallophosphatase superfamily)